MLDNNQFFQALKARLKVTSALRFVFIVFTSAIFPIAEGILINLWTSAQSGQQAIPGWTLVTVCVLHVLCLVALLISEFPSADLALARATEVEASVEAKAKEMKRRSDTYKMVRECLSLLTKRTCDLPRRHDPTDDAPTGQAATEWCQAGFEAGLGPIIKVVLDNITTTLGVVASQYTIEVHIHPGYVLSDGAFDGELILRFFYGLNVSRTAPAALENDSPARIGSVWDVPNQSHIQDNPAVFYENGAPKKRVYFRRFTTCPITEPCSDTRMGIMVLTSMQEEPFAADVCDTLQFIASIVSNYVSAYCECRSEYERHVAIANLLPDLSPEHRERLAEAMGVYEVPVEEEAESSDEPDADAE